MKKPDRPEIVGQRLRALREGIRLSQAKLAEKMGYEYIDVNDGLTDVHGMLRAEFTVEGIHMYANGYRVVLQNLKPYLTGVK